MALHLIIVSFVKINNINIQKSSSEEKTKKLDQPKSSYTIFLPKNLHFNILIVFFEDYFEEY